MSDGVPDAKKCASGYAMATPLVYARVYPDPCDVPNGQSNLIPKNQGDYILQVHTHQKNRTQPKTIMQDNKYLSSSEISGD